MNNNIGEKFLPLGTVVLLKNAKKRLMIIGFCPTPADFSEDKTYDYAGCLYPEGVISSDKNALFNHDQIEKVFHLGMSDEEEKTFKETLDTLLKKKELMKNEKSTIESSVSDKVEENINPSQVAEPSVLPTPGMPDLMATPQVQPTIQPVAEPSVLPTPGMPDLMATTPVQPAIQPVSNPSVLPTPGMTDLMATAPVQPVTQPVSNPSVLPTPGMPDLMAAPQPQTAIQGDQEQNGFPTDNRFLTNFDSVN